MKITTFDPLILTKDQDAAVKTFEALGFHKSHAPVTEVEAGPVHSVRMVNEDDYHVDISQAMSELERDVTLIRMNVDDFDAAYKTLTERGFTNTRGDRALDTGSAKAATMVSPSGFRIALVQHIKK